LPVLSAFLLAFLDKKVVIGLINFLSEEEGRVMVVGR
jgi:hypothetical protein